MSVTFFFPISFPRLILKVDLTEHTRKLALLPAELRFPDMANLKKLRLVFLFDQNYNCFVCPGEIPAQMADYCTSSFSSVESLSLEIQWNDACHLLYPPPAQPRLAFQPIFFTVVDRVVSDPCVLSKLKKVTLNVMPTFNPPATGVPQAQRDQLQHKGLEAFKQTAQRVDFLVTTQKIA